MTAPSTLAGPDQGTVDTPMDEPRYRLCASCGVEWRGDPACWLCGAVCPPLTTTEEQAHDRPARPARRR